jgi:hypothetical protein
MVMPKLLILSRDADEYERRIGSARLPDLEFSNDLKECDIVLGEPKLIQEALPRLLTL